MSSYSSCFYLCLWWCCADLPLCFRLSAVSHHLTLDRSRMWQDIEDEWAEAEAADKRKQLQVCQKILKTRAQVWNH